jgi:TetR/AcrR family transcriptional repressor of lmrAB and yxaGH operons
MPRPSDARERAIATTARLLQEQGYAGTGVNQILQESGAPKGSFYFHFPGGKEQLAIEALQRAGEQVAAVLRQLAQSTASPADLIDKFMTAEARMLSRSRYRQGCPIATVALEMSSESELIQVACRDIFTTWTAILTQHFASYVGTSAPDLAEYTIIALEGALLLSRVRRDTGPLLRLRDRLRTELESAATTGHC